MGLVVALVTSRTQRLGDLAAGTLVVRILDRAEISASPLVRAEVERLLASLRAEGEAPAPANPAPSGASG